MAMRRSYRRARSARPAMQWMSIATGWYTANLTATAQVALVGFEEPTSPGALTSAPPDDVSLIRIVGDFSVVLSAAIGSWTLGLMVTDRNWTPTGTFADDADKRWLWHQTYTNSTGAGQLNWDPPGMLNFLPGCREAVHLDVQPKVRLEAGKVLYLVAMENSGAATLTTSSVDMRVLFKRASR